MQVETSPAIGALVLVLGPDVNSLGLSVPMLLATVDTIVIPDVSPLCQPVLPNVLEIFVHVLHSGVLVWHRGPFWRI